MNYKWSEPFYGVSHMIEPRPPAPGIRQMTVTQYPDFAEAHAFGLTGFDCIFEKRFKGPTKTEDAKKWLEEQADTQRGSHRLASVDE